MNLVERFLRRQFEREGETDLADIISSAVQVNCEGE